MIYRLKDKKYGYEIQRATNTPHKKTNSIGLVGSSFWVSPSWMHNFLPSFDKVTDKIIGTGIDLTIFKRVPVPL